MIVNDVVGPLIEVKRLSDPEKGRPIKRVVCNFLEELIAKWKRMTLLKLGIGWIYSCV